MKRFLAQIGQVGIFDNLVVGTDIEQAPNPDWPAWAATRQYSFADMRAAFYAGLEHGKENGAFDDMLERVLAKKDKRKVKGAGRKKRQPKTGEVK